MAKMASLFCLLIAVQVLVFSSTAVSEPTLDIFPTEISLGVTSKLDANCTFSLNNHPDMAAFISLSLSRAAVAGENFEELAVITEFSPNSATVVAQEKVSATGVLSQMGESFLRVSWEYPTATQAGVYQCSAHGVDQLGHNVDFVNETVVTVSQADMNDIFEKLKEMESHIQTLENTTSFQQKYIQSLEQNISLMTNYITDLHSFLPMNLLGSYQDTVYYISIEEIIDFKDITDRCKSYGGKLLEIEDEIEFKAIQGFLNATSNICCVQIGGRYEASNGTWVFPSSNKTISFTAWEADEPNGNGYCLWLYSGFSWRMGDAGCHHDPPHGVYAYICEFPRVKISV